MSSNSPPEKTAPLTTRVYWDTGYANHGDLEPLIVEGFRHYSSRKTVQCIESLGMKGKRIVEIGAGNSAILAHLARKYAGHATFTGIDYSERGCALLAERSRREGAPIQVVNQDVFHVEESLLGAFDVVYSIGVAEHFVRLPTILEAKKRLLAPSGQMLTIIPNMAGAIGSLTRRYNRAIYDLHVPYDLQSFAKGHVEAGLTVDASGYICSNNFGVLSSCFTAPSDPGWSTYLWLTRLSKVAWFLEERVGELPHSWRWSPYLYAVSHVTN